MHVDIEVSKISVLVIFW